MLAVVVLAAGKGTRMRSDIPKVLHPLLGAPLLEYALERCAGLPADRRVVVVGFAAEEIRSAFADQDVMWAIQEEQLGTAHAAHVGVEALLRDSGAESLDVMVFNGDLPLLGLETLQRLGAGHQSSDAEVTVLTCKKTDPSGFGRIVRDPSTGTLRDIVEESDTDERTRAIQEVNVGAYVFRAATFCEYYGRIGRDNLQQEQYLTDVVVEAARGGRRVATAQLADESEASQVNSRSELATASEILRGRLLEELMDAGVTIDDPRTTYIEKNVTIGRDTRILPFTVIRRGVQVGARCEVGPFTHLRPGTKLEEGVRVGNFVEIKNSRLGAGTKACHLAYVGDGEVGEGVNLGAGTIFANFDGKTKNRTVVGDNAFVGSGTVLVAPVRVGKAASTGAGSVVLRNRDVPDGAVVVGVPAKPLEKKE